MLKILITVAILFTANLTFGESPQTPLLNQNKIRDTKGKSYQNQSTGTAPNINLPLRVQIVPPPENDPERNTYNTEQRHKTCMDWATIGIAATTVIVLFFQLIVFGRQARRLRETVVATEKAADAANKSAIASEKTAKSIEDSERPYIFIKVSGTFQEIDKGFKQCDYTVTILNHGKTPAILTEINYGLSWGCANSNILQHQKRIPRGGLVIACGVNHSFTSNETLRQTEDLGLYCCGRIDYEDIFKDPHYTKFSWVVHRRGGEGDFFASDDKELNEYT